MSIRLHVVYAGRGDALIVEDRDKLYLLDGGPLGYMPISRCWAPYFRYYMAALGEVSQEMGRATGSIAPDAVIISHGDEDHYGGIVRIFEEYLAPAGSRAPTLQKPLLFDEPLVTQRFDRPFDESELELAQLLTGFGFRQQAQPPLTPVFRAFAFAADPGKTVLGRAVAAHAIPSFGVDRSPTNLASVLAFHPATKMAFTGDSAGYLIAPFLARSLRRLSRKRVSIFKVPHHGSMHNSQREAVLGSVPIAAARQYGLLCALVGEADWNAIGVPADLREPAGALNQIGQEIADHYFDRSDPAPLRDALRAAFDQTLRDVAAGQEDPFVLVDAHFRVADIWRWLMPWLAKRASCGGPGVSGATRLAKRKADQLVPPLARSIFRALNPEALKVPFLDALSYEQLQSFFDGFVADNHVISANGTYRHPSAVTLAAIAAVAADSDVRPRVFVTDGNAVDVSAIGERVPAWASAIEIRYLARGARIVLDMTEPGNAQNLAALDPLGTTQPLNGIVDLSTLHAQFERNNGATIPRRLLRTQRFQLKALGSASLYLNLDAKGSFAVTAAPQSLLLDEAWTLSGTRPQALPFPASFDDVVLRADAGKPGRAFTRTGVLRGAGTALRWQQLGAVPHYVSTVGPLYTTTDVNEPGLALFAFTLAPAAAARHDAPPGGAERTVSLRAFCEAVGVPTEPPPSCTALLPQLAGPEDGATLAAEITLPAVARVLGWEADLDASTVTYAEDEYGPLVSTADVAIRLGTPRTVTIDERSVEIERAAATLARELPDGLTLTGSLTATDEVGVSQTAAVEHPVRTRTLDQYLYDVGMDPAQRPLVTSGTLLSALVGAQPIAEQLLLHAPSFIVAAGIAEWLPDHAATQLETQRTASGETEVLSARVVLQTPGGIAADVEGMVVEVAGVALTVRDARLPTMEVALEAVATVARGPPLALTAFLTQGEASFELAFPASATLADLVEVLPGTPDLGALAVPSAAVPLGDLGLSAPAIVVRQPSVGAGPYALAEVNGTVAFGDWRRALPAGWVPLGEGAATVRVLSPLDDEHRALELDAAFDVAAGTATLAAVLSAAPLPASEPAWAWTASAAADPATDPCEALAALDALGLAGPRASLLATLPALAAALPQQAVEQLTVQFDVLEDGTPTPASAIDVGLVQLAEWDLLPGIASLGPAQVALRYAGGAWSGQVEAELALAGGPGAIARVTLPTPAQPGMLVFENGAPELTLGALAALCGLGDFGALPLVAALIDVEVDEVELALAYPSSALTAAQVTVQVNQQQLGVLALDGVTFAIQPVLLGAGGTPTGLWLEGRWDGTLVATVVWEAPAPELLAGQLRPIAQTPIGELLGRLLNEAAQSTLLPAVAQLLLADGTFELGVAADHALSTFALRLADDAALPIASAAAGELVVQWAVATPDAPGQYRLEGTIRDVEHAALIAIEFRGAEGRVDAVLANVPDADPLTAPQLLELLGLPVPDVLVPDGAPAFDELPFTSATATLSVDPFQLETLTVLVATEATLALLAEPAIELTSLTEQLDYERMAQPVTRGVVSGRLALERASVTLPYVREVDGVPEFRAAVTLAPADAPDYRALISAAPWEPGYQVPGELDIPAAIPLTTLTAAARPGAFVEVEGFDADTTWTFAIDRLTLRLAQLGGRVHVAASPPGYAVALRGTLRYDGFAGAGATFAFAPGQRVLTAAATEDPTAIDLPAIASGLGPAWADLVPVATPPFAFTTAAWTYADLTPGLAGAALALYGPLGAALGDGGLLGAPHGGARGSTFALGLGAPFTLGRLWSDLGALVDPYVSLQHANAAVLGYVADVPELEGDIATIAADARSQSAAFTAPFGDLPPLHDVLPTETALREGLWLFAALDLAGHGTLTGALARIADPAVSQPPFVAWAEIDHAAPAQSAFSIALNGLVLLGAHVVLEGIAAYRPSVAESLSVAARVAIAIDAAPPCAFTGTLTIDERAATLANGTSSEPIVEPFGMTGVTIEQPQLEFAAAYPPADVTTLALRIAGRVELRIAGAPQACEGIVHFLGADPVVAEVPVPVAMGILDVLADLIPGAVWPQGYAPFDLTLPRLSSADVPSGSVTVDGRTYPAGYHAIGGARFLGAAFRVDAAIGARGIAMTGVADAPIDLVYLVLGGASVRVETSDPNAIVYVLRAEPQVFHAAFEQAQLAYRPALAGWEAALVCDGDVVGVTRPTVALSYRDAEGLRLLDWPVRPQLGEQDFDWAGALEAASRGSDCGQLRGVPPERPEDPPITTRFDLHIRQAGPIAGDRLPLVLGGRAGLPGTCTVSVDGTDIGPLPMPDTAGAIDAPGAFELSRLREWVVSTLRDGAAGIGASLLEATVGGRPALERLVKPYDLDEIGQQQLERLLCRDVSSDNVARAANATVAAGTATNIRHADDASSSAHASSSSDAIGIAAGEATDAGSTLGLAHDGIAGLTPFVALASSRGVLTQETIHAWEGLRSRVDLVAGDVESACRRVVDLITMRGVPACAFPQLDRVQVTWDDGNLPAVEGIEYDHYRGFSFTVEIAAEAQFERLLLPSETTTERTLTLAGRLLAQVNTVYVRVRALYEAFAGGWIDDVAFHRIPLPSPATVSESYLRTSDAVVVTVTSVPGATAFTLQLVDVTHGDTLVAMQNLPVPAPAPATVEGSFAAAALPSDLLPTTLLLARACATGDPVTRIDSPFVAAPAEQALPIVAAPAELEAVFRLPERDLRATWNAVPGATAYAVEVTGAHGEPLVPEPSIAYDAAPGATISGTAVAVGGTYRVRVHALQAGRVSIRSAWVTVQAQSVPAPANPRLAYATALLATAWDPVAGAARYLVDLRDPPAHAEVTAPPVSFGPSTGVPLRFGRRYEVAIRALAGSSLGPPAAAATSVPSSVEATTNDWDAALPVTQAAQELHALAPGMGPAELWDTLLAGGYGPVEATVGVRAALPATTTQELMIIVEAIKERSQMLGLLHAANVTGPDIVPLCRAIYSPLPLPLTILLKAAGVPPSGLAAALATAFTISLADAETIVREVYG